MKRKLSISATVVLVLIGALLTFQVTYSFVGMKYQNKLDELAAMSYDFSKLAAIDALVRDQYPGVIDEKLLEESTLRGYMNGLGDSGCYYLDGAEFDEYVLNSSGDRCGVGVAVRPAGSTSQMIVYSVYEQSSAELAGMLEGDCILSVNGIGVSGDNYSQLRSSLYGKEGDKVKLVILRGDQVLNLELSYAPVKEHTLYWKIIDGNVGYVRIYSFNSYTVSDFCAAVDALEAKSVKGIVFDLRHNNNGSMTDAVSMLDYLINDKVLARSYVKSGDYTVKNATPDHSVDNRFSVIVDGATGAGAELFAASLRDCTQAAVVGENTFGDGHEKALVKLADRTALVLTLGYYAPAVSDEFENVGVKCDIASPLYDEGYLYRIDVENDMQLKLSLESLS